MGLAGKHAMGLADSPHHLNNWNPWINSNVLTANLLLEKDPQRRQAVVEKVCGSVDEFLGDYSPDAGCEEGPGYWARSADSFFDCCWTLASSHAGKGDSVLKHPFTRAMRHYISNVHIAANNYVNYGDAHLHDAPSPDLTYGFGRATGDEMLARFHTPPADCNVAPTRSQPVIHAETRRVSVSLSRYGRIRCVVWP